jgi:hypothetical protein
MATIISSRPSHEGAVSGRTPPGTLQKALLLCGILSSLVYVAADVTAGLSWSGYSFAAQTISELSAIGAPSRRIWLAFGYPYDLFLIAFGIGVWRSAGRRRRLRISGALLIAIGAVGSVWPPMHVRGSVSSLTDTLHIVWAAIISLLILLAIGFGAGAFGTRFRRYSLATLAVLLVAGMSTFRYGPRLAANQPTPGIGVLERINLAVYLAWVIVLAVVLLRAKSSERGR